MDTQSPKEYRTPLTVKLEELTDQGFTKQFQMKEGTLQAGEKTFETDELTVVEEFRFEGESNPGDMSILYALEARDGTRGTVIDAYGTYSDNELGEFMSRVKERNKD